LGFPRKTGTFCEERVEESWSWMGILFEEIGFIFGFKPYSFHSN